MPGLDDPGAWAEHARARAWSEGPMGCVLSPGTGTIGILLATLSTQGGIQGFQGLWRL